MPHLNGKIVHCDPVVLNPLNSTTSELRMIEHIKFMVNGQTLELSKINIEKRRNFTTKRNTTKRSNFTKKNKKSHEYEK